MRSVHVLAAFVASVAVANNPPGSPPLGGPMSHVLVTVSGGQFFTGFESPGLNPVRMQNPGVTYEGGAAALNGTWFNAQYGWLVSGFWGPPSGGYVWFREIEATDGLDCYLGRPFNGMAQFAPIFGTAGSSDRLRWDGVMLHNYYAVRWLGDFSATYEVYFGDITGEPLMSGATPTTVTVDFTFGDPDVNGDGLTDVRDLYAWHAAPTDADDNGSVETLDGRLVERTIRRLETADVSWR